MPGAAAAVSRFLTILLSAASLVAPRPNLDNGSDLDAASQCEARTINYITHTLPQSCLTSTWTSSAATVDSVNSTATVEPTNDVPVTQGTEVTDSSGSSTESTATASSGEGETSQDASASETKSDEPSETSTAEAVATPFMSFEDWKEKNLREAGQDPQNLRQRNPKERSAEDRSRPDFHSDLGEEGEISLDFDEYINADASQAQGEGHGREVEPSKHPEQVLRYEDGLPTQRSKDAGKTCKERFSYSSFDAGATVLKSGPNTKNAKAILVENKDSYMLLECSSKNKFVIVELSDDILIDTIVLANFEFFSSMIRHFRLSVSDLYPVRMDKWRDLGTFEARNSRDIQAFLVENPQIWAKYVRIEFLTHYGNEYYCPVSLLRVHGSRMLDSWKDIESRDDEPVDEPLEEIVGREETVSTIEPEAHPEEQLEGEKEEAPELQDMSPWKPSLPDLPPLPTCATSAEMSGAIEKEPEHDSSSASPEPSPASRRDVPSSEAPAAPVETPAKTSEPSEPSEPEPSWASESSNLLGATGTITTVPTDERLDTPAHATPNTTTTTSVSVVTTQSVVDPAMQTAVTNTTASDNSSKTSSAVSQSSSSSSSAASAPPPSSKSSSPSSSSKSPSSSNSNSKTSPASSNKSPKPSGTSKSRSGTQTTTTTPSPTVQQGFFNLITKRLQQVETNLTLSLKYVEDQSRHVQDVLTRVENKHATRVDTFLSDLNRTVLDEMRTVRDQYEQIWQSTIIALDSQRDQSQRHIVALSARLNVLADEVVFQKRMAIFQAVLLLSCLVLVIFSRGVPMPSFAPLLDPPPGMRPPYPGAARQFPEVGHGPAHEAHHPVTAPAPVKDAYSSVALSQAEELTPVEEVDPEQEADSPRAEPADARFEQPLTPVSHVSDHAASNGSYMGAVEVSDLDLGPQTGYSRKPLPALPEHKEARITPEDD